jgi:tetratricopeptide (TPR) repeat protein/O-antigen ligase
MKSSLATVLRWLIYASALMPLIIFSQYISPFHFGKVIVFRILVEVMLVLYVPLALSNAAYRPRTNRIFWAFAAFTGAFTLVTLTSPLPYVSFWGTLERMGGLFTFWHYFIYFVILTAILKTEGEWMRLFDIMICSAILSAFYGFLQRTDTSWIIGSGGRQRIFGTIGNPALFAGYELVNTFLALTLYFRPGQSSERKWFYGSMMGFGSLAILMTVVRGSILGLAVGAFSFALLYYMQFRSAKSWRLLRTLSILAVLGVFVVLTPVKNIGIIKNSAFLSRLTTTSFESFTAKTRFWAWQAGLQGWKESPKTMLLGWGPENFNIPFSKHFNPKFFTGLGSETLFDRAHNMFVEILVTMGVVGFLTYVGMFAVAFAALARIARERPAERIYAIGLTSLIIAYIIHNSFIFDTSSNFLVFFTVLGFIAYLSSRNLPTSAPTHSNKGIARMTGVVLAIGTLIMSYRAGILPAKANYATTRAVIAGWNKDFSGAMTKYRESIAYDMPGTYDYRHRMGQFLLEQTAGSQKLTPETIAAIHQAIDEIKNNTIENPYDYLPWLYLSRLHIILGREDAQSPDNDLALENAKKALDISPTFIRTYYEIAQAYLNKKDRASAIEYFKHAAQLNPEVGLSYWYWGMTEYDRGNTGEGLRIIEEALAKNYDPSEAEYARLADVYLKLNDYERLADIYKRLTSLNPKKAQYFASLAVVYAKIGRIDEAVAAARQAAALDASFAPEARAFIQSLGRQF